MLFLPLIVHAEPALLTLVILLVLSFIAGFIDAVVGGGGLIQVPALLIAFPTTPLPTLFGTNKISALSGTSVAAIQYARKIIFDKKLLLILSLTSFLASFIGARAVSLINVHTLKPAILFLLILIAIYTFFKKELGAYESKQLSSKNTFIYGALIALFVGFYDGFFGPGTGSFFVLGFVVILGFDFLKASAYAKVINCVTNFSALTVFIYQGNYMISLAIYMAISNVLGNYIGSKMALSKGNKFIRIIFLCIVILMILRYAYDLLNK